MANIFQRMLMFKQAQKAKWARLLRLKFLIGRMRLNRVMLQWKVHIRQRKVERLRYTIISHRHYKVSLQLAVNDWKHFIRSRKKVKGGLTRLEDVIDQRSQAVFFSYLRHNMLQDSDLELKSDRLIAKDNAVRRAVHFRTWKQFLIDSKDERRNTEAAVKLRRKL